MQVVLNRESKAQLLCFTKVNKIAMWTKVGRKTRVAITRRKMIQGVTGAGLLGVTACQTDSSSHEKQMDEENVPIIKQTSELPPGTQPWPTIDPFLFCVYHKDFYPKGNAALGPAASLDRRRIGSDFAGKDGWRMYHGETIPGFPSHPHRGFETITVVRKGMIDHADSLGAAARYGDGDVQWLTAGAGIQHSEMFPLLRSTEENPTEFFQIWLNLPKARKFAKPHFSMMWADDVPDIVLEREGRIQGNIQVIAGELHGRKPPSPPPDSYGAQADSDLAIWSIQLHPGATLELPGAKSGTLRALYYFQGSDLHLQGKKLSSHTRIDTDATKPLTFENGPSHADFLVLQGRPIQEPVVKHGPFVMNSTQEIQEAILDYRATGFGGWPWPSNDPVHGQKVERFARYGDGRIIKPT